MKFDVINAPHINANDLEMKIVKWEKSHLELVEKGDIICTVETTKTAIDIVSDYSGYIYYKNIGDIIKVGDPVAYILRSKDTSEIEKNISNVDNDSKIISKKARKIIEENNLSLNDFDNYTIISSDTVVSFLRSKSKSADKSNFNHKRISSIINSLTTDSLSVAIYCEDNLSLLAIDAFFSSGDFNPVVVISNNTTIESLSGIPIVPVEFFEDIIRKGVRNLFINNEDSSDYKVVCNKASSNNMNFVKCIHRDSSISKTSTISKGVFIGAGVIIGPEVAIGENSIILAGSSIAHHCSIMNSVVIADGTFIGGNVIIKNKTNIGIGVIVNKRISIGESSIIVSGSVIIDHVNDESIVRM
jgi:acetyltransferase-like isoleucine patch superfamily enzyme